jgi:hypothetical protein
VHRAQFVILTKVRIHSAQSPSDGTTVVQWLKAHVVAASWRQAGQQTQRCAESMLTFVSMTRQKRLPWTKPADRLTRPDTFGIASP